MQKAAFDTSRERLESSTIAYRLARKLNLAYNVFYATFGMIAGLLLFCSFDAYSNTESNQALTEFIITDWTSLPCPITFETPLPSLVHISACEAFPVNPAELALSDWLGELQLYCTPIAGDTLARTYAPQGTIKISGKVTETHSGNIISAAKVVVVTDKKSRIDSAYTDNSGLYSLGFTWTGLPSNEKQKGLLYPNPYAEYTMLTLYLANSDTYSLNIFDINGTLLLQNQFELTAGFNTIALSGGGNGVHLIYITNGSVTKIFRAVQVTSTYMPVNAQLIGSFQADQLNSNMLKSMLMDAPAVADWITLEFSKTGYYPTDTAFKLALDQTINKQLQKIPVVYSHYIDGHALSSIAGKLIKDNSQIYIVKAPADTAWVSTSNEEFNYSWTDATPVTSVKVGGRNIPGHLLNDISANISTNTNVNITFNGVVYNLSQPILVKNQYSEALSGAQIAGGDSPVTTNSAGGATFTKSNLETDINNLPLSSYATNVNVTKNNIQTLTQTVYSNVGNNAEQLLSVIQEYIHFLYGNSTTPDGTTVKGWKNGTAVHTGIVSGTNYETNHVTRTTKTFTLDSLTFEKAGYTKYKENNVELVEGGNKKEATLQQIPVYETFTLTLKPFLESGEPVTNIKPGFSNTIHWPDNTTNTYTVNGAGEIVITKQLQKTGGSFGTATINNDTTDYNGNGVLGWIIIREPNQATNVANVAQSPSTALVPAYTMSISLDALNNRSLYEYTVRKKAEGQPGVWYRMDKQPATGFIGSSGVTKTSGFIQIPSTVAPYLDFVQKGWNETTGVAVPQADLDRATGVIQQTIAISSLANGDELLPPHRVYTVPSTTDPNWQALVARGFDNSVRNAFYNSTPANGREWIGTYTYNGQPRIWRTTAKYNINSTNGQIFSENYSATYGIAEGTGSLAPYVYNPTANQPTELGSAMARASGLLNLGTQ